MDSARPARGQRFSLASMLRLTTLVSLVFGWMSLVAETPPHVARDIVLVGTVPLAAIVAWRRRGDPFLRLEAGIKFFIGGEIVGMFTWAVGLARQESRSDIGPGVCFPVVVLIFVIMLRGWIWSANDRQTVVMQGR